MDLGNEKARQSNKNPAERKTLAQKVGHKNHELMFGTIGCNGNAFGECGRIATFAFLGKCKSLFKKVESFFFTLKLSLKFIEVLK